MASGTGGLWLTGSSGTTGRRPPRSRAGRAGAGCMSSNAGTAAPPTDAARGRQPRRSTTRPTRAAGPSTWSAPDGMTRRGCSARCRTRSGPPRHDGPTCARGDRQREGGRVNRFWSKVNRRDDDGCWLWTAARAPNGYGHFWLDGTMCGAHRVAYELLVGPIPNGLQIDHLCRNRACVNPAHMESVTASENARRGELGRHWRLRTHCVNGHNLAEHGRYGTRDGYRVRICRTCGREGTARFRARRGS